MTPCSSWAAPALAHHVAGSRAVAVGHERRMGVGSACSRCRSGPRPAALPRACLSVRGDERFIIGFLCLVHPASNATNPCSDARLGALCAGALRGDAAAARPLQMPAQRIHSGPIPHLQLTQVSTPCRSCRSLVDGIARRVARGAYALCNSRARAVCFGLRRPGGHSRGFLLARVGPESARSGGSPARPRRVLRRSPDAGPPMRRSHPAHLGVPTC